jgi:NADH-quinone oxidoreductase subunit C
MTLELTGAQVANRIAVIAPGTRVEPLGLSCYVDSAAILAVARALRDDPELRMQMLTSLTAVDYLTHFEIVYHCVSLAKNHLGVLKVRIADREDAVVPSVTDVWWGAHLQEREAYDLMGIRFEGHPDMRRIFLWEGFAGHPLRKDFMGISGAAQHAGLPHFPKQEQGYGVLNGPLWSAENQQTRPDPFAPGAPF